MGRGGPHQEHGLLLCLLNRSFPLRVLSKEVCPVQPWQKTAILRQVTFTFRGFPYVWILHVTFNNAYVFRNLNRITGNKIGA